MCSVNKQFMTSKAVGKGMLVKRAECQKTQAPHPVQCIQTLNID